MSLTVKAYYERGEGEPEIRRFAVDAGVSSSYQYLISKIQQVFGAQVTRETVDLFWKDSDGDKVSFSSDEELTDALGYVNDGVFRIYIRPKTTTFTPKNEGEEHPGVVCDGCNNTIRGSRFKCMECPDYDLCTVCENKGEHAHHRLVRLRNPGMSPWGFEFGGGFPFGPQCGPPSAPPGPPGQHGHGPPHGPHHPPPPPQGPPPGPWGGFGPGPGWPFRKMMKRAWRQWMRNMMHSQNPQTGYATGPCVDSDEEMNRPKEPRKDDCARDPRREKEHMQREGQESEKCDKTEGGEQGEEYLRNVGESVAAMLDPLGISVDVDVEHSGKRKRCHGGRRGGRGGMRGGRGWGGMWAPWSGMFGGGGGMGGGRGGWPGPYWNEQGPPEQQQQQQQRPGEPTPGTSRDESHEQTRPDEPRQQQEPTAPSPVDVQMNSPSQQTESDGEWMVLNKEKTTTEMESSETSPTLVPREAPAQREEPQREEPPSQMYPNLEAQHPDPKINEALKQLMQMGFNNDGGWLVSLLEAKGGDINKTLDALKPHKPQ